MIRVPENDDIKVFNIKTFRDPLSNIIDMNYLAYTELMKFCSQRSKTCALLQSNNDTDFVRIWNPRSAKR
jgi:hypothetical protein